MNPPIRLALFAVAAGLALVLGLGVGSVVGPFDDEPVEAEHGHE